MSSVVVTDYTFPDLAVEAALLEPAGVKVIGHQAKTPAECAAAVAEADFVITQFAPVKRDVIAAMSQAQVIVRYGIGVDNVDLEAASRRGILVANAPESTIVSAAEHTLGLLLALSRGIPQAHAALKQGRWERSRFAGLELAGVDQQGARFR